MPNKHSVSIAAIQAQVGTTLPEKFEPLLLSFYRAAVREAGQVFVIGDDEGTELCFRPSDGAVVSIDPRHKLPPRFVNSEIALLAEFVNAYKEYAERVRRLRNESEAIKLVQTLRVRLSVLDPAAFESPDPWWATVLEQAEAGLL